MHFQPPVKNCWLPWKHYNFCKMKKPHHILHSSEKIQMSIYKLLQIATKIYYKLRQLNYYKLRQNFITHYDSQFITNYDNFITNYDSYYKLRQIQYKLQQQLQIATIITNYDGTPLSGEELHGRTTNQSRVCRFVGPKRLQISKQISATMPCNE